MVKAGYVVSTKHTLTLLHKLKFFAALHQIKRDTEQQVHNPCKMELACQARASSMARPCFGIQDITIGNLNSIISGSPLCHRFAPRKTRTSNLNDEEQESTSILI
eukprot:scaffold273267_cov15-Tisochrysis_lutea.AAC.1